MTDGEFTKRAGYQAIAFREKGAQAVSIQASAALSLSDNFIFVEMIINIPIFLCFPLSVFSFFSLATNQLMLNLRSMEKIITCFMCIITNHKCIKILFSIKLWR